jgi:hypothetical protein
MNYKIFLLGMLVFLLIVFPLAGCGSDSLNTEASPSSSQSVIPSLVTSPAPGTDAPLKTIHRIIESQRPIMELSRGIELKFETVTVDRLPGAYLTTSPLHSVTSGFFVLPINTKPNFDDYNDRIFYKLTPETRIELSNIDYTRYLAIMLFQENLGYHESSIQAQQVRQEGDTLYIISRIEEDYTQIQPLATIPYQVIKLDKTQMPQLGWLNIRLIDETGFERNTTAAIFRLLFLQLRHLPTTLPAPTIVYLRRHRKAVNWRCLICLQQERKLSWSLPSMMKPG